MGTTSGFTVIDAGGGLWTEFISLIFSSLIWILILIFDFNFHSNWFSVSFCLRFLFNLFFLFFLSFSFLFFFFGTSFFCFVPVV
jgi:hypothetical protein